MTHTETPYVCLSVFIRARTREREREREQRRPPPLFSLSSLLLPLLLLLIDRSVSHRQRRYTSLNAVSMHVIIISLHSCEVSVFEETVVPVVDIQNIPCLVCGNYDSN